MYSQPGNGPFSGIYVPTPKPVSGPEPSTISRLSGSIWDDLATAAHRSRPPAGGYLSCNKATTARKLDPR